MIVGVNCGHTLTGPGSGAVGTISESKETRNVGYTLMKKLKERGAGVVDCTVDKANSQSQYLSKTVELANKQHLDLFVSIHFNAGKGKGVEVFTYGGKRLDEAVKVCDNVSSLGFINRGIKDGSNLYVIRKSRAKAMLIEVCFVDSKDTELYLKLGVDRMATAIADAIIEDIKKEAVKNYAILYSNEIDKVGAEILSWGISNSTVLDINNYKGGYWGVICVGGKTETELKAKYSNINYTCIKGNDRYDTVRNCLKYLNK